MSVQAWHTQKTVTWCLEGGPELLRSPSLGHQPASADFASTEGQGSLLGPSGTALGVRQLWCSGVFVGKSGEVGCVEGGCQCKLPSSASLSKQPLPLPRSTEGLNWASVYAGSPSRSACRLRLP